jgi:NAD(P)-dependent dehydrogenase (short-subunit alcohol dehydrogenase family)
MMSAALEAKVAVVTGAGRGIGRAYAHLLAAEGAAVVVNDLAGADGNPAADVVAEIEKAGGRAVADNHSVAVYDEAAQIMQTAVDAFGRLDILVANAGIIRPVYILDAKEGDWSDVLAVHANGTYNCIRHAAPHMVSGGGGSIITTGDIATDVWFPRISSYRASKAAIVILTQHAANELHEHHINVNSVMPGPTITRLAEQFGASLGDRAEAFMAAADAHYRDGIEDGGEDPVALPDSVPALGMYLCTEAARGITGYAFQLSGHRIGLVTPRVDVDYLAPERGSAGWTLAELAERVPGLVEAQHSLLRL